MIPRLGRRAIRVICQAAVTFHRHLWASPVPPRRASDTTRSALEGVGQNCFGRVKLGIGILQQDTELPNLQFSAQQIFDIVDWARSHLKIDPKIGSLEGAFNCSRHAIHSALANGLNEPKSRGRHFAVSAESDANILVWITGKEEKNAAVTRTDIRNYCQAICKIEITRGWVDSFISHHSAELIEKKS
jgi:hypothetical protein